MVRKKVPRTHLCVLRFQVTDMTWSEVTLVLYLKNTLSKFKVLRSGLLCLGSSGDKRPQGLST